MRRNWMAVATAVLCAGMASAAFADTTQLTLTGTGGQVENDGTESVYVYPYLFTVGTGPSASHNVALMCISFQQEIWQGETWHVTVSPVSQSSSDFDKEEAFLDSLMLGATNPTTIAEIQYADWDLSALLNLLGPQVTTTHFYQNDSNIATYVSEAINSLGHEPDSFYSQFVLYTPVPGSQIPVGDGLPQTFMGPAPTPEPGSLALLGTGLLGLAGIARRRLRQ